MWLQIRQYIPYGWLHTSGLTCCKMLASWVASSSCVCTRIQLLHPHPAAVDGFGSTTANTPYLHWNEIGVPIAIKQPLPNDHEVVLCNLIAQLQPSLKCTDSFLARERVCTPQCSCKFALSVCRWSWDLFQQRTLLLLPFWWCWLLQHHAWMLYARGSVCNTTRCNVCAC